MSDPETRETAGALLIDIEGRFLLQRRDNVPGILYPGHIGLFGGHREGDETFLQCVSREVHEETGYRIRENDFEQLGWYRGVHADGVNAVSALFIAHNIPVDALIITEESLLILAPEDVPALRVQMSPSARAALEIFKGDS